MKEFIGMYFSNCKVLQIKIVLPTRNTILMPSVPQLQTTNCSKHPIRLVDITSHSALVWL